MVAFKPIFGDLGNVGLEGPWREEETPDVAETYCCRRFRRRRDV
jgi:hypothetical protein